MNKEKIEKLVNGIKDYNIERFIKDSKRYTEAIKQGRIIVNMNISKSGITHYIKFLECHKMINEQYSYITFYSFFTALGYTLKNNIFKVTGLNVDVVFMTNYNIIHQLSALGLVDERDKNRLVQLTPTVI